MNAEEWGKLEIIKSLMKKFVSVNYHANNWACLADPTRKIPSGAMDVTLINKNLIKTNSHSKSFLQNSLNQSNNPNAPDCQPS